MARHARPKPAYGAALLMAAAILLGTVAAAFATASWIQPTELPASSTPRIIREATHAPTVAPPASRAPATSEAPAPEPRSDGVLAVPGRSGGGRPATSTPRASPTPPPARPTLEPSAPEPSAPEPTTPSPTEEPPVLPSLPTPPPVESTPSESPVPPETPTPTPPVDPEVDPTPIPTEVTP